MESLLFRGKLRLDPRAFGLTPRGQAVLLRERSLRDRRSLCREHLVEALGEPALLLDRP